MNWLKKENPLCIKTDAAANLSQGIFFVTYALYLIFRTASESTYKYDNSTAFLAQCAWICCFVAFLSIVFLCRYTVGQLLGILALLGVYVLVLHCTEQQSYIILQSLILVFACRHVKWEHLLRFSLVLYILIIATAAVLEQVGVLPVLEMFRGDARRYTLGFSHPNVLGGYCLCLVIIWLLIRFKNLKFYDYIGMFFMAAFLWFVPNSRTGTFSVLILCLLAFIFKRWGDSIVKSRIIQALCLGFGWLMAAFSILASYFYDSGNALYVAIDKNLFTTRLSLAQTFLDEYPVTLFGQKLKLVGSVAAKKAGTKAYILDNFYVRELMNYGVVSLVILLVLFTYLTYRAIHIHDYALLVGLLVMLIYCVYENRGVNLVYNVLLFQLVYQMLAGKENDHDPGISNYSSI